jgi:hypothetical protein
LDLNPLVTGSGEDVPTFHDIVQCLVRSTVDMVDFLGLDVVTECPEVSGDSFSWR